MRNQNNELANRTFDTTPVAGCQPEAFCLWTVPTDTHGRGGNMGDRSVALKWSSAVDAGQIGPPIVVGATGRTSGVSAAL